MRLTSKEKKQFISECEQMMTSGMYETKKQVFDEIYKRYGFKHVWNASASYYNWRKRRNIPKSKAIKVTKNERLQKTLDYINSLGVMDNAMELSIIKVDNINKGLDILNGFNILYFLLDEDYNINYVGRSEKICQRLKIHKSRSRHFEYVIMARIKNKELLKSYERYIITKINLDQHEIENFRTLTPIQL